MGKSEWKSMMGLPAPGKSKGNYPVVRSNEIQGGLRTVDNEAEMTQIPPWYRQEGMEVYVTSTQKKYRLNNNPKTKTTVLLDWTVCNDGLTVSEQAKLMTKAQFQDELAALNRRLGQTYVTLTELEENYLSAQKLMGYFQTVSGMSEYVSVEMLERLGVALSKVVVRVVPPDMIRVKIGTDITEVPLPTSVVVSFADGKNLVCPVSWVTTNYDPNVQGLQMLAGRMYLPEYIYAQDDIPNLNQTRIFIQVFGNKKDEIIDEVLYNDVAGFVNPDPIEVEIGTELWQIELPQTVKTKLVDPSGEVIYEDLRVTWDTSTMTNNGFLSGVAFYGEVSLEVRSDAKVHLSNTLKLQPVQAIKVVPTTLSPVFQYQRGFTLKAGKYEMESDIVNRIDHITCEMLYGVDNDPAQRQVEVRFMGLLKPNGSNATPEILERYPEGIRMPVLTSNKADVEAFIDCLKSFNEKLGYRLELEVPGGISDPRLALDDEKHLLSFGSAVLHDCLFLIRRSKTTNLPYPDVC
jgi:hypothetical protein